MQEKKALDEASNRWWTTGEFTYQACINSMLVALELDNGLSQCGFRTDLPGFILVGQFLVAVMATLPRADALKGMESHLNSEKGNW
ncbi:hypothetical protein GAYE_SCF38G5194 [Galdieria yellowstonensis]|uniref:Uncharacterized protein n=1 Tax=Galdieria yellowstonensis TaxID=3028027 RepID=A0AAV9IIK9_9RHOD|nr:hypothetical protein GAYE_SCF38G5194 [Galdieria yellowstonensis]